MVKPLTGIAIIRCQLSEEVCPRVEWKKYIEDNPNCQNLCVKMEEIIVILMDCMGCQENKNEANKIKTIASHIIEKGIDTIFLTACMCRNMEELKSHIGIKCSDIGWINTFVSFFIKCIGGVGKKSADKSCALYQNKIIGKCPNSTAFHLLEFIKDNYSQVNVVIRK